LIHSTQSIGQLKVDSAARAVEAINPNVRVETHAVRIAAENAEAMLSSYDIIADGSDNFATRYLVADTAERVRRPLVTAAVGRFDGSITVLKPWESDADGIANPSYRDLFPEPPPPGVVPSCAEAGVLGVLTGILGSLQALEVIKLITGAGTPLIG